MANLLSMTLEGDSIASINFNRTENEYMMHGNQLASYAIDALGKYPVLLKFLQG